MPNYLEFGRCDQFATKQIVSGLTNYSQLCYANSMLQLIATMPEYISYFKQLREKYITPENHKSAKVLSSIIATIDRINRVCPGFVNFVLNLIIA